MKLSVLVDNNTYIDQYYCGEPAVSYYIETENKRILFDAGYSDVFLSNAEKMGIDLRGLTHIVLSHGHNDHSGGLQFLFARFELSHVNLIAHPDCFLPKYDDIEYIGAPYSNAEVAHKANYIPCCVPYKISENLIWLGEIPRRNDFEIAQSIGKQKKSGQLEADYVMDDTALIYRNSDGLFIITGCSHSGICNIVQYAKEIFNEDRIIGILGGFHLFDNDQRLQKTIRYLNDCNIKELYPCHCVSLLAKAEMMKKLPVIEVGVGMTISLK